MKSSSYSIALGSKDRRALRTLIADGNTPQKIAKRAQVVLMTADGSGTMAIMRTVGVAKKTVWRWRDYFVVAGVAGLVKGRSKPPGKKPIADEVKLKVVEKTMKQRPANATHWSLRSMAAEMGISHTCVQLARVRAQAASGAGLNISNHPDFVAKVKDVVDLYLDPPENALVLAVDERARSRPLTGPARPAHEEGPRQSANVEILRLGLKQET